MKLDGKMIVWPSNLDSTKTRLEGRKIPKNACVQAPRIDEINEAARKLSIETEITQAKSRPRTWWEKTGYIITPKTKSKQGLLRLLATEIRRIRASRTEEKTKKN